VADVVVLGSANVDFVFKTERLPTPGETVLGDALTLFAGGKGANQAVASAKMGAKTELIACIGTDANGDWLLRQIEKSGVQTSRIRRTQVPTGVASICVDSQGRNMIVVAPGANGSVIPSDALYKADARVVLAQNEVPIATVERLFGNAVELGTKWRIYNPAPALPLTETIKSCANVIVPNETEAAFLTGEDDPVKAGSALLDIGFSHAIITRGAEGASYFSLTGNLQIPAPEVEAIDTVAAGDTLCGALAAFLGEGMHIVEALQLAVKAASISVTRVGAQASIPERSEVI
jgi:ribokinase